MLSSSQIAQALRLKLLAVQANWPHIATELATIDGYSEFVQLAAAATIRVECPTFVPQREQYDGDAKSYFVKKYWDNEHVRRELGNLTPEDAAKYFGRGYIQLTGLDNYHRCGLHIDVDLRADPDRALEPAIAAKVFCWFFRKCYAAANQRNYTEVRHLVNGGANGLNEFLQYVHALEINSVENSSEQL